MTLQANENYNISFEHSGNVLMLSKTSMTAMNTVIKEVAQSSDPEVGLQQWNLDDDLSNTTISLWEKDFTGFTRKHYIQVQSDNDVLITHDLGAASRFKISEDGQFYNIKINDGPAAGGYLNVVSGTANSNLVINPNVMVWNIQKSALGFQPGEPYHLVNQASIEEGIGLMLGVGNPQDSNCDVILEAQNIAQQNMITYQNPIPGKMSDGQLILSSTGHQWNIKGTMHNNGLLGQTQSPPTEADFKWSIEDYGVGYVRVLCKDSNGVSIGYLTMNNDNPDNIHLQLAAAAAEGDPAKKQTWKFTRTGAQPW